MHGYRKPPKEGFFWLCQFLITPVKSIQMRLYSIRRSYRENLTAFLIIINLLSYLPIFNLSRITSESFMRKTLSGAD